ncbi:MAG: NusG domain II-containing protein [Faecalibacterium sp.]
MKHKNLFVNLIFAAVILAAAGILFALRGSRSSGSALSAQLIYGSSNTVLELPLNKDASYDIDTGYYTVHIEIKDGAARFVDSPCPDHICESFGWLSAEDQTATCLPARAVLTIVPAG